MAHSTIPLFESPAFPQLALNLFEHQIASVDQILGLCSYETPESSYGACDGGIPCRETATVHHLASDQPFCMRHFKAANRG